MIKMPPNLSNGKVDILFPYYFRGILRYERYSRASCTARVAVRAPIATTHGKVAIVAARAGIHLCLTLSHVRYSLAAEVR